MMYDSKLVLAVRANGRVLREVKDTVFLPFGCEYSLLIKNLNSVKALVKVWIDGTDATEGTTGLIVNPNSSIDLERFIKSGNLSAGNKFKFIERTKQISNHRGNKIDDGLIRLEFEYERLNVPIVNTIPWNTTWTTTTWPTRIGNPYFYATSDSAEYKDALARGIADATLQATYAASAASLQNAAHTISSNTASVNNTSKGILRSKTKVEVENDTGITVAGAVSNQQFSHGYFGLSDGVKHSMVLRMLGEVEGQAVQAPVTVKTKLVCSSCGTTNKHGAKFCRECGTGLQIV